MAYQKNGRYRGSTHHSAKLTEQKVREIRAGVENVSQAQLARIYGVSKVMIHKIVHREAWSWLK